MITPGDVTCLVVTFQGQTTIFCRINPCVAVLAFPTIGIGLTDTSAFCSIEATTLTLLASVIEIAGFTHRHRIGGVAPRQLTITTLALVIASGDVTDFVIAFQGQATILGAIEPCVTVLA